MSSQEKTTNTVVVVAVVVVSVFVLYLLTRNKGGDDKKTKYARGVVTGTGPAKYSGSSGSGLGSVSSLGSMAYRGAEGPLPANTYTFTTAGPRIGVSIGSCATNIQPIQSAIQNFTGAFAPCGM